MVVYIYIYNIVHAIIYLVFIKCSHCWYTRRRWNIGADFAYGIIGHWEVQQASLGFAGFAAWYMYIGSVSLVLQKPIQRSVSKMKFVYKVD